MTGVPSSEVNKQETGCGGGEGRAPWGVMTKLKHDGG